MRLGTLLDGIAVTKMFQTMYGRMVVTHEVEVRRVQYDSRKVGREDVFVAIQGSGSDGHAFLGQALANGAKVVVVERDDAISDAQCMHTGVVKIVVSDTRRTLAQLAANFYGHPAGKMTVVGVTGTNGKTTTAHLLRGILDASGERAGLIGTIEHRFGTTVEPATHTTPESLELQQLFARMRDEGATAVAMEVSSHALDQHRVDGVRFSCAVFTNLTQDHLDYHGTMENYFSAKQRLFEGLDATAVAVTNLDDPWGRRIAESTKGRCVTYGRSADSTVRLVGAEMSIDGSRLTVSYDGSEVNISTPLVGPFNVSNALAAVAAGFGLGIRLPAIELGLAATTQVRGRFERISSPKGWMAIVDYAHTPDALEKCLGAIREVLPERARVITVFGAGGDRDRTKRPAMGEAAGRLSDVVVVTSDNPRTEDPERIIDDVIAGITAGVVLHRETDRRKALALAVSLAQPGDIILVAGKGHEDYQVIGRERRHFSDREEIEALA